jgi:hypothetical protein
MLGKVFAGRKAARGNRKPASPRKGRRLSLERMEERAMFTHPLGAPSLTAAPYNTQQVDLSWTSVPGATNYLVDYQIKGMTTQVAEVSGGTTRYSIIGLQANTTYSFGVAAWSNSAGGTWSNWCAATTFCMPPQLTATSHTTSSINLAWTCASTPSSYLFDEWVSGAWQPSQNVGNMTSMPFTWSDGYGTHEFRVGAVNSAGTEWSGTLVDANGVMIDHPAVPGGVSYANVAGTLFGPNGPSYADVQQGSGVGDCWLIASLSEVAARAPQDITSMFTSAGTAVENGVTVNLYKVRFYNSAGTAEYVTVDTEFPTDASLFDQPVSGVLWVSLAEKAYAQANGEGYVTSGDPGIDSYRALNHGCSPRHALEAITGNPASSDAVNPTNLAAAWTNKNIEFIVMCSSPNAGDNGVVGDANGTHAYAMIGYNASSSTPFEFFNPWHVSNAVNSTITWNGHQVYGGPFWLSGATISQDFAAQDIGSASAVGGETADWHDRGLSAEARVDLVLARWNV